MKDRGKVELQPAVMVFDGLAEFALVHASDDACRLQEGTLVYVSIRLEPGTRTGEAHVQAATGTTATNLVDAAATDEPVAAIVLLSDGKSTVGSSIDQGALLTTE